MQINFCSRVTEDLQYIGPQGQVWNKMIFIVKKIYQINLILLFLYFDETIIKRGIWFIFGVIGFYFTIEAVLKKSFHLQIIFFLLLLKNLKSKLQDIEHYLHYDSIMKRAQLAKILIWEKIKNILFWFIVKWIQCTLLLRQKSFCHSRVVAIKAYWALFWLKRNTMPSISPFRK